MLRNSAVNSGSRSWIKYRFPIRIPSSESVRFRAIWLIHNPFADGAIPATSTLRVARSMKNRTTNRCKPRRVHTSTVKKSVATIISQCLLRNSCHVVFRFRSGAGSIPCRCRIAAIVLRASLCPRLDSAPSIRRQPQSRFSCAMRTTRASISSAVRGRPGERWAVPSYFWAISFRCQANKVSGVTMLATSARAFRLSALAFYGQPPALIVIEAHSLATELFSQHPILFAEIFNDLQLAVVHPPGDGDQQKLEWVEHSLHIQNPLSRPPNRSSETSHLHADPVFGPYGVGIRVEGRRRLDETGQSIRSDHRRRQQEAWRP